MANYYEILGVSVTATEHEIKRAFRRLAIQYHPDKNADPQAEDVFKSINEAYDTLGDPFKKSQYDQRLLNPFRELLQEEPIKHRDPRYRPRRKPPGVRKPEKSAQFILMEKWNWYARWINNIGFAVVLLFALDYVIPYNTTEETIAEMIVVRGRRGEVMHYKIYTVSGKTIKAYNSFSPFLQARKFMLTSTRIYRTPLKAVDLRETFEIQMGYMYQSLAIIPGVLLVVSSMGIYYRNNVERAFNYCIGTAILLIITLVLIF